jgi:ABC-2 type transport system permease protein
VDGEVKLTAIWTPDTLPDLFAETPDAVRQAVEELKEVAAGRLVFEEVDPAGDEQLAQRLYELYGARPMSLGLFGEEEFYLYALLEIKGALEQIVLTGEVTAAEVRESVENSLRRHTPGFLKSVGVVTSSGPEIPPQLRMQMNLPPQEPPEFQEVQNVLGQDYQVQSVDLGTDDGVPTNVDVLLVLKPKNLGEAEIYNLDQYLMRGGRVIVCASSYGVNFDAGGLSLTPIESGLDGWLGHHGVSVQPTLVLDDRNQPLPIPEVRSTPFGTMRTWTLAPYPYLVQVRDEGFRNSEITASLDSVGIYWGSPLQIDEEITAGFEVMPVLQSSNLSWTNDDLSAVAYVDYDVPAEGTEPHLLAAALSGRFKSYYTDRPIPGQEVPAAADAEAGEGEDHAEEPASPSRVALEESPETRLIVVGNAEVLSDFVARALASVDGGFFVENLRFAQNLIDWAGLDNDMLGIRSRGMVSRRLERVGKGQEVFIETVNYVVPVVLLVALGSFLRWRRHQTPSIASVPGGDVPLGPVSHGEVGR